MRIDTLQLKNFKCFEDISFELHPQFNVFIGDNGKGKTAVCEAAAIVLSDTIEPLPIKENSFNEWIKRKDVRTIYLDHQPKPQYPASVFGNINIWDQQFQNIGFHWVEAPDKRGLESFSGRKTASIFKENLAKSRKESGVIFPLLSYYGSGRRWSSEKKQKIAYQKQEEGIMMAYPDALDPNQEKTTFLAWYKTLIAEINELDREMDKTQRKVIDSTLDKIIPNWTTKGYSFKQDDLIGEFEGEIRQFRQLSDGYRNTIGMIADMIYRCIQLNPHLGEKVLEETPGVVIIDELDLHLHPKWQARIINDLHRIFPKVQFIATTHSPVIVSHFDKEIGNLYVVEPDSIQKVEEKYFGKEVNDVLTTILGATDRHIETQQELNKLVKLVDEGASEEDYLPLLKKLEKMLGKDDIELQKVNTLISWNQYKKDNPDAIHS